MVRKDIIDNYNRCRMRVALDIHEISQGELKEMHPIDECHIDGVQRSRRLGVEKQIARDWVENRMRLQGQARARIGIDTDTRTLRQREAVTVPDADFQIGAGPRNLMDHP